MNLTDYQQAAARTANPDAFHGLRCLVSALGLVGEATEIKAVEYECLAIPGEYEKRMVKELGDFMWYAADLCTAYDIAIPYFTTDLLANEETNVLVDQIVIHGGKVGDYLKKVLGHGHQFDCEFFNKHLGIAIQNVEELALRCHSSLAEVCDLNIAKLKERYPNGFDPVQSQNRRSDDK